MLAHLLGGGQTSYLYRKLVIEAEARGRGRGLLRWRGARRDPIFRSMCMPPPGVTLGSLTPPSTGAGGFLAEGFDAGRSRARQDAAHRGRRLRSGQPIATLRAGTALPWRSARPSRRRGMAGEDEAGDRRGGAGRRRADWLERSRRSPGYLTPPDQRGGLKRRPFPAPHRAKKTTHGNDSCANHFPVPPRIPPSMSTSRSTPRRCEIRLVRGLCGAARHPGVGVSRRSDAGSDGKGGAGRADPRPFSTRAPATSTAQAFHRALDEKAIEIRSTPTANTGAAACARSCENLDRAGRTAAACAQRAALRRGALRARSRAHERASAPRGQRSGHAGLPRLEGESLSPVTSMANLPTARWKR